MFVLKQIDHVALTVRDVARSIAWYRDILGLERRHEDVWGDAPAMMYAGDTALALFPASAGVVFEAPDARATAIMRHLAFQVDEANFIKAQETLRARGVDFVFQDHSISRSIYFLDPDGYELELTTYELTRREA